MKLTALPSNATPLPLTTWLDMLAATMPPTGALMVGAGNGTGTLTQWLLCQPVDALLVEGDESQYHHLQRCAVQQPGFVLQRDVVAGRSEPIIFHSYSNPAENGLLSLEPLRTLWPQLFPVSRAMVAAPATIDTLIASSDIRFNWLIIDCLPAEFLLQGAMQSLMGCDVVICRIADLETNGQADDRLSGAHSLLAEKGLRMAHQQSGRHPAIGHAVFVRDLAQQAQRLNILHEAAKSEAKARADAEQEKLTADGQIEALQQQIEELNAALQSIQSNVSNLVPCLFALEMRVDSAPPIDLAMNTSRPDWVRLAGDVVEFNTEDGIPVYLMSNKDGNFSTPTRTPQLPIEPDTQYRLSGQIAYESLVSPQVWLFQYDNVSRIDSHSLAVDADGRFRIHFKTQPSAKSIAFGLRVIGHGRLNLSDTKLRLREGQQGDVSDVIEDKLKVLEQHQQRDINSAVRQIESFIRLQHYLGPDVLMPEVHNWPISPDLGVLLIKLVEQHAYDAVIEFGSGTSTLVLAKALDRVARRANRKPSPLLSFDHLPEYEQQTRRNLMQAGLDLHARVVLAPLIPWRDDTGCEFSYYACDDALAQLKNELNGITPKILVLVDGPPASTGSQARYPAMPKVLQHFSNGSQLHFLMDDYIRSDEQQIVHAWEAELSKQAKPFRRTVFDRLEKKACILEIPSANTEQQA